MTHLEYFSTKLGCLISPMKLSLEMSKNPNNYIVIDVRNPSSQLTKKIKGSISIPQNQITTRFLEIPKDKIIILYCWSSWCLLASEVAVVLLDYGYPHIKELSGGFEGWNSLNLPTETA